MPSPSAVYLPMSQHLVGLGVSIEKALQGVADTPKAVLAKMGAHGTDGATTLLMLAAFSCNQANLRYIIEHSTRDELHQVDSFGFNALFYAVKPLLQVTDRHFGQFL